MTAGSWEYYVHELSVEDYFVGHGEEAGVWVGSGAAVLGLSGEVEEGQLAALFDEGRDPVSGAALGLAYRHDSKRAVVTGFALSFSPPKSVSLVGAFGDAPAAADVRDAHDSAVRAALSFLEDHAAFSRMGRGGAMQVDTAGFVAAAFTHHTSRAGDPQLHSHVLVANKVWCADGRWRSLDGRELFAFQNAAGMLYNATLRVELTARLGVAWDLVDRNGQADIAGVPKDLIALFSKRRRQVERRGAQRIATARGPSRAGPDRRRAGGAVPARHLQHPPKQDPRGRDNAGRSVADGGERRRTGPRHLAPPDAGPGQRSSGTFSGRCRCGHGGRDRGRAGPRPTRRGAGPSWPRRSPGVSHPAWERAPKPAGNGSRPPPPPSSRTPKSSRSLRRCRPRSPPGYAAGPSTSHPTGPGPGSSAASTTPSASGDQTTPPTRSSGPRPGEASTDPTSDSGSDLQTLVAHPTGNREPRRGPAPGALNWK